MYILNHNRTIQWSIICVLISLGLIMLALYLQQTKEGMLTIEQRNSITVQSEPVVSPQQPLEFEIQSGLNNLSAITLLLPKKGAPIRLNKTDIVTFKIREKNSADWLFSSNHPLSSFFSVTQYTFSFKPIATSQNKSFIVSISVNSPINTSFALYSQTEIVSHYYFNPRDVASNGLLTFLFTKLRYGLADKKILATLISFVMPVMIYIVSLLIMTVPVLGKIKKTIRTNGISKLDYLTLGALLLIFYNLPFPSLHWLLYLTILLIWISAGLYAKTTTNTTLVISLLFLLLIPIYQVLEDISQSERLAAWVLTFLFFASIQRLIKREFE